VTQFFADFFLRAFDPKESERKLMNSTDYFSFSVSPYFCSFLSWLFVRVLRFDVEVQNVARQNVGIAENVKFI
jgi:hypothetical protein